MTQRSHHIRQSFSQEDAERLLHFISDDFDGAADAEQFNRQVTKEIAQINANRLEHMLAVTLPKTFSAKPNGGYVFSAYANSVQDHVVIDGIDGLDQYYQTYVLGFGQAGTATLHSLAIIQNSVGLAMERGFDIEKHHTISVIHISAHTARKTRLFDGAFDNPTNAIDQLEKHLLKYFGVLARLRPEGLYCRPDQINAFVMPLLADDPLFSRPELLALTPLRAPGVLGRLAWRVLNQ